LLKLERPRHWQAAGQHEEHSYRPFAVQLSVPATAEGDEGERSVVDITADSVQNVRLAGL
jgi:hypothetical protein